MAPEEGASLNLGWRRNEAQTLVDQQHQRRERVAITGQGNAVRQEGGGKQ